MTTTFNTWLPGQNYYTYNNASLSLTTRGTSSAAAITIADGSSGFGITYDMIYPPFNINLPPIVSYISDVDLEFVLRDSDGWSWVSPMPAQISDTSKSAKDYERGWAATTGSWGARFVQTASPPMGYRVSTIAVDIAGAGYLTPPEVVISRPDGGGNSGVRAQAVAVLGVNGSIDHITVTGRGSGYSSAPATVTIAAPPNSGINGQQATAHVSSMTAVDTVVPTGQATGPISLMQIQPAAGISSANILLNYITSKPVGVLVNGNKIKLVSLTITDPRSFKLNVGDVMFTGVTRDTIHYAGSLPFGFALSGPSRDKVSTAPYRGPFTTGYQSGTPWALINDGSSHANLSKMLDFMLDGQTQFTAKRVLNAKSPISGPFMHCYLPATWDSLQTGTPDTWVWEAPDGNPSWDGWQYRAFDCMGRTLYTLLQPENVSVDPNYSTNVTKAATICTRFIDWMYDWLVANVGTSVAGVQVNSVPNNWAPPGWVWGMPFPIDSYLDPRWGWPEIGRPGYPSAHDCALMLKAAVFVGASGSPLVNVSKCKYIIQQCITFLRGIQHIAVGDPMNGAFTKNAAGYEVYGFEQGEIMESLALALQHPSLLQ